MIAQPLIFFRSVLFNPQSHIPFDIEAFHLPLATYIARCARERIFPFWDPYPYCGVPIHADITAQLYYPFTWIAILLGNHSDGRTLFYWIEWLDPFHMILAGVFTFLLLRQFGATPPAALLGGTVYQLGGYFASQAQHLCAVCCGAWFPLVLLCVLKLSRGATVRWTAMLGLSVALTILSGFPAATFVVFGSVALFVLGVCPRAAEPQNLVHAPSASYPAPTARERLLSQVFQQLSKWKLFAAVLAGLALGHAIAAIQLIPAYQLGRLSIASMRSEWHVTGGGLRFESLASLVVPNYYHIYTPLDPSQFKLPINFTFLYVYCGLIPLALVLLAPFLRRARTVQMLFVLTIISVIWMLGDEMPLYRFAYTHLPRFIRGALYAEFALMAFCMFMALTSALALNRIAHRAPAFVLWCLALLTALDLTYFGSDRTMNSMPGGYQGENSEYHISGFPGALSDVQKLVDIANPPLRLDYMDNEPWNFIQGSEIFKLPTADGDNPFLLKRILFLRRLFCGGYPWERELPVNRPGSPLVSMLNTGYLGALSGVTSDKLSHSGLELAGQFAGLRFYRVPQPLPRFFLVRRLHLSHSAEETFSYLARQDFKPADEAIVEARDLPFAGTLGGGAVSVKLYMPNQIELEVAAGGPAFLASSETLYPGWTVTINGKPRRFYMTNGAFRGVALDPGANHVVMTYWPEGFLIWTAISIASLILALAGLLFGDSPSGAANPAP